MSERKVVSGPLSPYEVVQWDNGVWLEATPEGVGPFDAAMEDYLLTLALQFEGDKMQANAETCLEIATAIRRVLDAGKGES